MTAEGYDQGENDHEWSNEDVEVHSIWYDTETRKYLRDNRGFSFYWF